MSKEQYPVSDFLKVVEAVDIYKTEKWWKAVLLTENKYGMQISVYLWTMDKTTGKWKRKQKMGVRSLDELNKIVEAIKQFLGRI